jgi:GT2 family glycosyltransferase
MQVDSRVVSTIDAREDMQTVEIANLPEVKSPKIFKSGSEPCPDVSIVIVTWNAQHLVVQCLASIAQMSRGASTEIIVVDNASSDCTPEMIRRQFPEIRLIANEANLGFAKANNIGIAASRGKYICLINSDVIVPPECIPLLVDFMEANPNVGMAGPQLLGTDGNPGRSVMRFPTLWNTFCRALSLDSFFGGMGWFRSFLDTGSGHEGMRDVDILNGWFWIVRRDALPKVGLLDEGFFMYGEDMDWSWRFHGAGWRVVLYPAAKAVHYGGGSSSKDPTRFRLAMHRANLQFWAKYHGTLSCLAYRVVLCFHETVRVLGYGAAGLLQLFPRDAASFKVRRSWAGLEWLAASKEYAMRGHE